MTKITDEMINVDGYGVINQGDYILLNTNIGNYITKAKRVINKGTDKEEVIVHTGKNHYFITSLILNNKGWVKKVRVLKNYKYYVKGNVKGL